VRWVFDGRLRRPLLLVILNNLQCGFLYFTFRFPLGDLDAGYEIANSGSDRPWLLWSVCGLPNVNEGQILGLNSWQSVDLGSDRRSYGCASKSLFFGSLKYFVVSPSTKSLIGRCSSVSKVGLVLAPFPISNVAAQSLFPNIVFCQIREPQVTQGTGPSRNISGTRFVMCKLCIRYTGVTW